MAAAAEATTPQLPPLPHPIALFPAYIARQTETLLLKEKLLSLSGDSFSITTHPAKTPILAVSGTAFSLSGRKTVTDAAGQPLFQIRKQLLSIPSTYYAERPDESGGEANKIFEVKGKWSLGRSKAVGTFNYHVDGQGGQGGERKEARLVMKGDFFDRKAEIVDEGSGGVVVARIDRKFFNARELLGGKQSYAVSVAPGMDMAVVVAMCICLDERRNDGLGGGS